MTFEVLTTRLGGDFLPTALICIHLHSNNAQVDDTSALWSATPPASSAFGCHQQLQLPFKCPMLYAPRPHLAHMLENPLPFKTHTHTYAYA